MSTKFNPINLGMYSLEWNKCDDIPLGVVSAIGGS